MIICICTDEIAIVLTGTFVGNFKRIAVASSFLQSGKSKTKFGWKSSFLCFELLSTRLANGQASRVRQITASF